jgi:hypothetical protein
MFITSIIDHAGKAGQGQTLLASTSIRKLQFCNIGL